MLTVPAQHIGELLEREAELSVIADLVHSAARGVGAALVIEGEAGVGKTRLLDAAGELAADQPVRLLRARGGELERGFPFGVAAQLLTGAVAALKPAERRSLLSGAAALAASVVDPTAEIPAPDVASEEALFARLHGLYWVTAGLATQAPLILLIDDAHWADDPSLQWLLFLVRRLEDMPVSVVLAARSPGTDDWPAQLAMLRDDPHAAALMPQRLSGAGSAEFVRAALDPAAEPSFCAACHAATAVSASFRIVA